MENLKSQKNGVKEIVASCFRPSEHVSLLSIAGEHFPCSAIQPTHNSAVKLKTSHLDALKCVVLFPNRLFSFVRIKKKKREILSHHSVILCVTLTCRRGSILRKCLVQVVGWMSGLCDVRPQKPVEKCRDEENHIHMS